MGEKSVLLVEDEDGIALALEFLISRQGYDTRRVTDGDAALRAMEEDRPDLVVLDVMLPERSGYEVCQIMRQDEGLKHVKVLMMTARGGEVERRKGLALGADAFLTKPFATADLTAQIRALLGGDMDA
ncbi:response regulator [Rhodovulum sulfidophilum]|uniref:Response regulator n=1 Tax=Rhodovulum sulfidophilum TaxID=35806 RepID=A0A0D6AY55_RHOSU|nr:response regulator [Rhodovulum sulfidophilum]ANB33575.1 two-component system response regulator [Rhodovulum sulfidophilum DSM 1374]ANB37396.1 two-component system response regulator [Rhodovulum sulfidophilum]MBK5922331.1 response regulator [Rhodovulum sulfidophilum]MBL3551655.1 response regulator [Rhodovulum sulfidophilum]MBL3564793.1 response regulator [Rhodovulum sulfidophilum]